MNYLILKTKHTSMTEGDLDGLPHRNIPPQNARPLRSGKVRKKKFPANNSKPGFKQVTGQVNISTSTWLVDNEVQVSACNCYLFVWLKNFTFRPQL